MDMLKMTCLSALVLSLLLAGCSCGDDDDDDSRTADDTGGDDTAGDDAGDDDVSDDSADDDTVGDDTADDDIVPVCSGTEIFCEDWEGDALGAPGSPWVVETHGTSTAVVYEIGTKESGQAVKLLDEVIGDAVDLRWIDPVPVTSGLLTI
jgi:hypothetical protein